MHFHWLTEYLTRQVLIGQWGNLGIPIRCAKGRVECGKVYIPALPCSWALCQCPSLKDPTEAHTDMLWVTECSSENKKQSRIESCTSELWHHVEILHKKSSALPWAVGEEVKRVAYLHVTWEQNNVPLVHMGTIGSYISSNSKQILGIFSSGVFFFLFFFKI